MDVLGVPTTVTESQQLGGAAVQMMLTVARFCPGAVMDSTWYAYSRPLITRLDGCVVEVHCSCPVEVARERYRERAKLRHGGHLDDQRTDDDLFGRDARVGLAGCIEVDTATPIDVSAVVDRIWRRTADAC